MDKTLKPYPAKALWSQSVLGTARGSQWLGCFIQVCSLSPSAGHGMDLGVNCLLGALHTPKSGAVSVPLLQAERFYLVLRISLREFALFPAFGKR